MAARVCVALVALAVLGWLAVMERDLRASAEGEKLLQRGAGASELERAEDRFRAARLLNPDTAPDVGRALVLSARGDPEGAVALVEEVLRREPDNLRAWRVLALLAVHNDPGAVRRSLAAQRRLDPVNAPR